MASGRCIEVFGMMGRKVVSSSSHGAWICLRRFFVPQISQMSADKMHKLICVNQRDLRETKIMKPRSFRYLLLLLEYIRQIFPAPLHIAALALLQVLK